MLDIFSYAYWPSVCPLWTWYLFMFPNFLFLQGHQWDWIWAQITSVITLKVHHQTQSYSEVLEVRNLTYKLCVWRVCAIPFITGNEIKTTVKYHDIPTKWLKLQRITKSNSSKNEELLELSTVLGECKMVQSPWKRVWQIFIMLYTPLSYNPAFPLHFTAFTQK